MHLWTLQWWSGIVIRASCNCWSHTYVLITIWLIDQQANILKALCKGSQVCLHIPSMTLRVQVLKALGSAFCTRTNAELSLDGSSMFWQHTLHTCNLHFCPLSHYDSVVDSVYYFSREKTGEDKCSLCLRSAVFCPQVKDLVSTSLS